MLPKRNNSQHWSWYPPDFLHLTSQVVLVVKNLPANAGDTGSIPGLGRSPGRGHGNPPQYSCLENPTDRGAWQATVHRVKKSQTRLKRLNWTELNWSSKGMVGKGHGSPLQCSWLENPVDRGAWWVIVCRIAQSWTRLKRPGTHSTHTHSSVLAWRIPQTGEPCRLQSKGLQRVRHDWVTNTFTTSLVFLPTFLSH